MAASMSSGRSAVCRAASRNAQKYTEDGRIDEKRTSQFPAFERAILANANTCLDEWRDKAIDVAKQLVSAMRSCYPCPVRYSCWA